MKHPSRARLAPGAEDEKQQARDLREAMKRADAMLRRLYNAAERERGRKAA